MINFTSVSIDEFLKHYWQKKPLVIRNAITDFTNPLSVDEVAGLALELEIESRLVTQLDNSWQLQHGPFEARVLRSLPKTHWTLLVQGVDRSIAEVNSLLDHFDFIPQWRLDDVMISIASMHGGVGPHYDNYDVFLYQAQGQKKWSLTTKNCNEENCIVDSDLRIMAEFDTEQQFILNEGDMLYLPPHVAHDGIAISDNCITYSFGYRSYQGQELWDSFGDYLAEEKAFSTLYADPCWAKLKASNQVSNEAINQAKNLMQKMLNDESALQQWFCRFATQLDEPAMQIHPLPLTDDELISQSEFIDELQSSEGLLREATSRMAYALKDGTIQLFINSQQIPLFDADEELMKLITDNRFLSNQQIKPFLNSPANQTLLYHLWAQQYHQLHAHDS